MAEQGAPNKDPEELQRLEASLGGKYRVLRVLGRGGFGSVYLVEIAAGLVGQKLALKVLPAHLTSDDRLREQFINEIRVAMRLVDKYIIQIRDVGTTDDDQLYYTMDYSPGVTLAEILKSEGRLSVHRACLLMLRVLRGLQTAHGQGVVHRDLKPANFMIEQRGGTETVRVLDFGIATAVQTPSSEERGKFVGSPHYMPPEQFLGEQVGFYTDLFAVGVVLYECLTGQRPYHGSTPQEVYDDLKSRPAVPPDEFRPELRDAPGLVDIVMRALERNPEKRYQTAKEFFNDLNEVVVAERRQRAAERDAVAASSAPRAAASAAPAAAGPAGAAPPVRRPRGVRRRPATAAASARARRSSPAGTAIVGAAAVIGLAIIAFLLKDRFFGRGDEPREPPVTRAPIATSEKDPKDRTPVGPPPSQSEPKPNATDVAAAAAAARERLAEYLENATVAFDAGKWFEAREHANEALTIDPANMKAYRLRGLAEMHLELWTDAAGSLQLAIDHDVDNVLGAKLLLDLVEVTLKGSPEGRQAALDILRSSLERDPTHPEVNARMAQLLDEAGDEVEIVAFLAEVAPRVDHPVIKELYQKWLVDLPAKRERERQARLAEARAAFDRGEYQVVIDKGGPLFETERDMDLGFKLSVAYREVGDLPRSLAVLHSVAPEMGANDSSIVLCSILFGQAYLDSYVTSARKEDLESAKMNLDSAVALVDANKQIDRTFEAMARTYRARCFALEGNLIRVDEDIKFAKQALKNDGALAFHQGVSYFMLGESTKDETARTRAIARLQDVINLDGKKDPLPYYYQGLSYLRLARNQSDLRNAHNRFASARSLGLDTAELYNSWAEAYYRRDRVSDAAKMYRESFLRKPDLNTCYWAGRYFLEAGLKAPAREILEDGLRQFAADADSRRLSDLLRTIDT